MTKQKTSIPLRRAYLKRARKTLGFTPQQGVADWNYEHNYDDGPRRLKIVMGTIHTFPASASIVRVGEDEIVVTDGSFGYMPFKLSELQAMLREAKELPVVKKFRCDVKP